MLAPTPAKHALTGDAGKERAFPYPTVLSHILILQPDLPGNEIPGHHEHGCGDLRHQIVQRHLIHEQPHQHLVQPQPDDT